MRSAALSSAGTDVGMETVSMAFVEIRMGSMDGEVSGGRSESRVRICMG
jgi:hypothetical protein